MKKIAILGATGSVGSQTADVAAKLSDDFNVVCISANSNWEKAVRTAECLKPGHIVMGDPDAAEKVRDALSYEAVVYDSFACAPEAVAESGTEYAVLATSGIQGISVFEHCMKNGIPVGLANKETVVCGGDYVRGLMKATGTPVYPIDSEHSAIYQCLGCSFEAGSDVRSIILTASGGPFYGKTSDELKDVTPEMALRHPSWNMGRKITIDSATLANKGQEVIEVGYLFGVPSEKINVLIHPQSIVHSAVEFEDGCILAQMGPTDMRLPIQLALEENTRKDGELVSALDLAEVGTLTFDRPDMGSFRCLSLAYDALKAGGSLPAVYSIADDAAVELFLSGSVAFSEIPDIIGNAMERHADAVCCSVDEILSLDAEIKKEIMASF